MSTFSTGPARRAAIVSACLVVAALILVPTLVRAMQHWERHQPIRTSIKLNWNGDAPRTKAYVDSRVAMHLLIAPGTSEQTPRRLVGSSCGFPVFVLHSRDVSTSDTLRGPPVALLA